VLVELEHLHQIFLQMVVDQQLVHWSTDQQVRLAVGTAVVALGRITTLGTLVVPVAEEKPTVLPQIEFPVLALLDKVTTVDRVARPVAVAAAEVPVEQVQTEQAILLAGVLEELEVRLL
jgi:hypothetical protein